MSTQTITLKYKSYIGVRMQLLILAFLQQPFPRQLECPPLHLDSYLAIHIQKQILQTPMKNWMTLLGFCLVNFNNALGFGIYTNSFDTFALYFNVQENTFSVMYDIGLIVEIILCVPVLKMIQWRLDYAIYSCVYLTTCSYWLLYFSNNTIALAITSYVLNSLGQVFILQTGIYLAEVWFHFEKRSLAIGLAFYANLLGFGGGAILTTMFVRDQVQRIHNQFLILAIISSIIFPFSLILVKNRPEVRIEKKSTVKWKHVKCMWKQKFAAFNVLAISAFLGSSWSFEVQLFSLDVFFSPEEIGILTITWIIVGGSFGIFLTWIINFWFVKTGNFKYYDWICKTLLGCAVLGYLVMGISTIFQFSSFAFYVVIIIFIGIGSLGFYGLTFLSLLESLYPIPSLLISTILILGASCYSLASEGLVYIYYKINPYFSIASILILPWLYFILAYETNFKRYKSYLNEKDAKYQLIKIEHESLYTKDDKEQ